MFASQLLSALASPDPYLDPGSGSMILQLILAAILGVGVVLRTQWARVKSLFKGKNASEEDSEDDE